MKNTKLIAVGACAVDTLLTVPHFPEEDSKLRASSFVKRRGGNSPNTFEVLQQLIQLDNGVGKSGGTSTRPHSERATPELYLIATLPSQHSRASEFIASSFERLTELSISPSNAGSTYAPTVNLSHCVYREDFTEPVSSYIISSQNTSSRTIISHNEMPEMTYDEFVIRASTILDDRGAGLTEHVWFHFEGRIPPTTLLCIRHLRNLDIFRASSGGSGCNLTISVELEKPGREGLQELAHEADVVFYSKAWAAAQGYGSAEACLKQQAKILTRKSAILICTWGDKGAWYSHDINGESSVTHSPAYKRNNQPILDTTGAGDTFIAGMLFGLINRAAFWSIGQMLDFANELAGCKILQQGFQGLGEKVKDSIGD